MLEKTQQGVCETSLSLQWERTLSLFTASTRPYRTIACKEMKRANDGGHVRSTRGLLPCSKTSIVKEGDRRRLDFCPLLCKYSQRRLAA